MSKYHTLLINPIPDVITSVNKDLNGGYGTRDEIGKNILSKLIGYGKKRNIKIPVLCMGYITSILKSKKIKNDYLENCKKVISFIKKNKVNCCIIYGSIVCYELETKLIKQIKDLNKKITIIVVGTYPTKYPEKFESADHIIIGEPEEFFQHWNGDVKYFKKLEKNIKSNLIKNLDELPIPTYKKEFAKDFSYRPMLKKPTGFIEATRGCPYSCGFYCTYGENQGKLIRSYSPEKVVEVMQDLIKRYGFRSFQFRDPVFGLKKDFIEKFCLEIFKKGLKVEWGMETRIDLLDIEKIRLMKSAGLKSINIGIETPNEEIAKANKRIICDEDKQKSLINAAFNEGIKINAFYILGLEQDNEVSSLDTIKYALSLNTFMARFAVCTPYPGTGFYDLLKNEGRIIENNLDKYNQQELVFKHNDLGSEKIKKLIQYAYIKYYFRPKVILNIIKNRFD